MKRLLFLVTYLLVFVLAQAQLALSVDVGYGNQGYSYRWQGLPAYDGSLPRGQNCYLAPRVGYQFGDEVSIGLQLGAGYSDFDYEEGYYDPLSSAWQRSATTNSSMLNATAKGYLRLRLFGTSSLSLHVELSGAYGMGWGWETRVESKATADMDLRMKRHRTERSICAQVVPVAYYALNDHWGVDLYLNLAALTFVSTTVEKWPFGVMGMETAQQPESETTTQTFDIGVNALNTRLLTIGFGYRF